MQQDPWSRMLSFVVMVGGTSKDLPRCRADSRYLYSTVQSTRVTEENAACPSVRIASYNIADGSRY